MSKIRVVIKPVGEIARVEYIENELGTFQEIVEGYIELLPLNPELAIVLNEEGKLIGLDTNLVITTAFGEDNLVGNLIFANISLDGFKSITDENIEYLQNIGITVFENL